MLPGLDYSAVQIVQVKVGPYSPVQAALVHAKSLVLQRTPGGHQASRTTELRKLVGSEKCIRLLKVGKICGMATVDYVKR